MRLFTFFTAALLFIATIQLPIGFYTALRILVFICSILLVRSSYQDSLTNWVIIFLVIAVLFNPIIPVYLYKKSIWIPIDIIAGILFMAKGLFWKRTTH
ncbi:DUF6804 family protein [Chitinophaga sp. LS1]|uniref:DUF6804 family protein n=1 Tax=Chitinophaga sp. LS1 TaxID=3051176 RepID=UPI0039F05D6B